MDVNTWGSKRQKSKGNGVESRTVNPYLDEVKADLVQCYRALKQGNRVHSLIDIFNYHNETQSHKLTAKTLCHYRTSQKYILAFVAKKFNAKNRYLQDLDYAFVLSFESFLRSYWTYYI